MMPKAKRAKSAHVKLKSMSLFYNKVCELVSLLGDLVDIQALTDTDVLQVYALVSYPNGQGCLRNCEVSLQLA